MIQPRMRTSRARRTEGIAEMRVARPAARPVMRAVGRSVIAGIRKAPFCLLFVRWSARTPDERGCTDQASLGHRDARSGNGWGTKWQRTPAEAPIPATECR